MDLNKKHGYFTSTTTPAFFVEETGGIEEVLKSITSLVESQHPRLTARAFAIDATPESIIRKLNTRPFSTTPINSSKLKDINPPKTIGSFWKRIWKNLSGMSFGLSCDHEWKPDYRAYGWGEHGEATFQNPAPCVLPPSMINLKVCTKCGKKK